VGAGFLITVLLAGVPLQAGEPLDPTGLSDAEVAGRGEEAFREGVRLHETGGESRASFRTAAALFEELRRRGVSNALLYRNLGNAHLLAGDLPNAILSYRRGLGLAPHDRDLEELLARGRDKVVYQADSRLGRQPPDSRPPWLPRVGDGWLFAAALGFYTLACIGGTRWLMVRRAGWLGAMAGGLAVAALLAGWLALDVRAAGEASVRPLVVIADDGVLLRKGNGLAYPPRYETPVNRGVEAKLLFERGDWLQIELAGGEVGWVPRRYALADAP
jgi:hypothetical protein